jgi:hypothetical protein
MFRLVVLAALVALPFGAAAPRALSYAAASPRRDDPEEHMSVVSSAFFSETLTGVEILSAQLATAR